MWKLIISEHAHSNDYYIEADGMYIAHVADLETARLMFATRDLLAACEKALAFHDRYCDRVGPADGWARTVHAALRAAVEKAKANA